MHLLGDDFNALEEAHVQFDMTAEDKDDIDKTKEKEDEKESKKDDKEENSNENYLYSFLCFLIY